MKKNIPNILTMLRFVLIPFILYFLSIDNYILTFVFLTLSGITDVLDGFIARKFNFITDFGKLIDPLADKATQLLTLAALVLKNIIPLWIFSFERIYYDSRSLIPIWKRTCCFKQMVWKISNSFNICCDCMFFSNKTI